MKQSEAIWIAISALTYVIALLEKQDNGLDVSLTEHLAEKREALSILNSMVNEQEHNENHI